MHGTFFTFRVLKEADIAKKVVINFEKGNDFLDAEKAIFLVSPEIKSPMGSNAAAFSTREAAEKTKAGKEAELLLWDDLYQRIK